MKKKTTRAKSISEKTKKLLNKVDLKIDEALKSIKDNWKKEQPKRDRYKKIVKTNANKFIKNSMQVSADVIKTIKKDLKDFKKQK